MNKNSNSNQLLKFVTHSKRVLRIAKRFGWLPGARYTNLRDIREFSAIGFMDIDWKDYDFRLHLAAVKLLRPKMTVARDVERHSRLNEIIDQAYELSRYADRVVIVPKDRRLGDKLDRIPLNFILGFSVPTRYGKTAIRPECFGSRSVHLLGGRPDIQRELARQMNVVSVDCNRFTLDATFGDYFDGETFRPHPVGGYERCVADSLRNINALWRGYRLA